MVLCQSRGNHGISKVVFALDEYAAELLLLLPLGIIGSIRWGVWIFKKVVGAFYNPESAGITNYRVSVVTPVYLEDPETFKMALESWIRNGPYEVIAVIDVADEACIKVCRDKMRQIESLGNSYFASQLESNSPEERPHLRLIITPVPGKRPALAKGIEEACCDIVALVDSDTIWDDGSIQKLTAPFIHPEVGGVTCRQRVYKTDTLSQKLTDVMFDLRYEDEMRFLGRMDQGFSCLSGRTAIYRRSALLPLLNDMVNETFLGRPVISGEDKQLTYLLQAEGYKTRHQENVIVFTDATEKLGTLLKQKIRWARNSWRSDLRALSQKWMWRRPWLALFLVDRCISAFTVLISPMVLAIAIYLQFWLLATAIPIWWMLGRTIKLLPYLKRHPRDIWIVPIYVIYSFISGVLRIYSLVTLNKQGWLTRGPTVESEQGNRLIRKLKRNGLDFSLTVAVLLGLLVGVVAYVRVIN